MEEHRRMIEEKNRAYQLQREQKEREYKMKQEEMFRK